MRICQRQMSIVKIMVFVIVQTWDQNVIANLQILMDANVKKVKKKKNNNIKLKFLFIYILEKIIHEVSFFGNEYIGYDLINVTLDITTTENIIYSSGIYNRREKISLYFKTSQPNGLLFVIGDNKANFYLFFELN